MPYYKRSPTERMHNGQSSDQCNTDHDFRLTNSVRPPRITVQSPKQNGTIHHKALSQFAQG